MGLEAVSLSLQEASAVESMVAVKANSKLVLHRLIRVAARLVTLPDCS